MRINAPLWCNVVPYVIMSLDCKLEVDKFESVSAALVFQPHCWIKVINNLLTDA